MTKQKALAIAGILGISALVLSAGTLAYFTDKTDTIVNTFTVGSVKITLDEAPIDENTNLAQAGDRVMANNYRHIMPGSTVDKDPTVTNTGKSDAWVRVKMAFTNGDKISKLFSAVVDEGYTFPTSITAENISRVLDGFDATKWDTVVANDGITFTYKQKLAPEATAVLFNHVKVATSIDDLEDFGMNLTAEAVQADGFGTAAAAFNATFDKE